MKIKFSAVVILCWTVLLVSGETTVDKGHPEPPPSDETTTVAPTPPPTNVTTTSTTTVEPTPPPTNATTTSTDKPPPPPPPTNSTTTTTTTTPAPTTTTSKPTPAPPTPEPTTGTWILNGTNATCIVIKMAVQFDITYETTEKKPFIQKINLPMENMTQVIGDCAGKEEQNMTISWKAAGTNNLTLHFIKKNDDYHLHHIEAVFSREDLPNISSNSSLNATGESTFKAHTGNSYKCSAHQTVNLKTNLNNTSGIIKVSNLQFQAFRTDKTNNFGSAEDCTAVGDIVPIAVGCVLIALVILVLVAYLIGRRRSQARGYLSM